MFRDDDDFVSFVHWNSGSHTFEISNCCIVNNEDVLAGTSTGEVLHFSIQDRKLVAILNQHEDDVVHVASQNSETGFWSSSPKLTCYWVKLGKTYTLVRSWEQILERVDYFEAGKELCITCSTSSGQVSITTLSGSFQIITDSRSVHCIALDQKNAHTTTLCIINNVGEVSLWDSTDSGDFMCSRKMDCSVEGIMGIILVRAVPIVYTSEGLFEVESSNCVGEIEGVIALSQLPGNKFLCETRESLMLYKIDEHLRLSSPSVAFQKPSFFADIQPSILVQLIELEKGRLKAVLSSEHCIISCTIPAGTKDEGFKVDCVISATISVPTLSNHVSVQGATDPKVEQVRKVDVEVTTRGGAENATKELLQENSILAKQDCTSNDLERQHESDFSNNNLGRNPPSQEDMSITCRNVITAGEEDGCKVQFNDQRFENNLELNQQKDNVQPGSDDPQLSSANDNDCSEPDSVWTFAECCWHNGKIQVRGSCSGQVSVVFRGEHVVVQAHPHGEQVIGLSIDDCAQESQYVMMLSVAKQSSCILKVELREPLKVLCLSRIDEPPNSPQFETVVIESNYFSEHWCNMLPGLSFKSWGTVAKYTVGMFAEHHESTKDDAPVQVKEDLMPKKGKLEGFTDKIKKVPATMRSITSKKKDLLVGSPGNELNISEELDKNAAKDIWTSNLLALTIQWRLNANMDQDCSKYLSIDPPAHLYTHARNGTICLCPAPRWSTSSIQTANYLLAISSILCAKITGNPNHHEAAFCSRLLSQHTIEFVDRVREKRLFCRPDLLTLANGWTCNVVPIRVASGILLESAIASRSEAALRGEVTRLHNSLGAAEVGLTPGDEQASAPSAGSCQDDLVRGRSAEQPQQGEAMRPYAAHSTKSAQSALLCRLVMELGQKQGDTLAQQWCAVYLLQGVLSPTSNQLQLICLELLAGGLETWKPHLEGKVPRLVAHLFKLEFASSATRSLRLQVQRTIEAIGAGYPQAFITVMGTEVCAPVSSNSYKKRVLLCALNVMNGRKQSFTSRVPTVVEIVIHCLDPSDPATRKELLTVCSKFLYEMVKMYPFLSFHQTGQQFAVGTQASKIILYDLRTATKLRVLEEEVPGTILAVSFSDNGRVVLTISSSEAAVHYWRCTNASVLSGMFGLREGPYKTIQLPGMTANGGVSIAAGAEGENALVRTVSGQEFRIPRA